MIEREKFIKTHIERGDEICAFERFSLPEGQNDQFFILELKLSQYKRSFMFMSSAQPICNSRLMVVDKSWTVRKTKIEIFKLFRPIIN